MWSTTRARSGGLLGGASGLEASRQVRGFHFLPHPVRRRLQERGRPDLGRVAGLDARATDLQETVSMKSADKSQRINHPDPDHLGLSTGTNCTASATTYPSAPSLRISTHPSSPAANRNAPSRSPCS